MKKINSIISRIFKTTMLFSIGMTFLFLIFSDSVCMLMYHNLEISAYVKLLSPLLLIIYLDTIVDSILKGLNEQLSVMKYNILDLFVSISFIYFLLPYFGANGYIIVIYISELLNGIISTKKLLSLTKVKIKYRQWILEPIIAGILALQTLRLLDFFIYHAVLTLLLKILIFLIIYLFYLYLMSCIDKSDIKI